MTAYDTNEDGEIDFGEARTLFKNMHTAHMENEGMSDEEIQEAYAKYHGEEDHNKLFNKIDDDKSGAVTSAEAISFIDDILKQSDWNAPSSNKGKWAAAFTACKHFTNSFVP